MTRSIPDKALISPELDSSVVWFRLPFGPGTAYAGIHRRTQASQRLFDHDFGNEAGMSVSYALTARVDLALGLAGAERALSLPSPTEGDFYQSQRVYLYADRVEEAAEIGRRYIAAATDPSWNLMVRIRQACAEGRIADADALYADNRFVEISESRNNIQWLALKTLGRKEDAEALLRPLDKPSTLYVLAGLLSYTHFDPRPFPNLAAALSAQGVLRENPVELNFACKR